MKQPKFKPTKAKVTLRPTLVSTGEALPPFTFDTHIFPIEVKGESATVTGHFLNQETGLAVGDYLFTNFPASVLEQNKQVGRKEEESYKISVFLAWVYLRFVEGKKAGQADEEIANYQNKADPKQIRDIRGKICENFGISKGTYNLVRIEPQTDGQKSVLLMRKIHCEQTNAVIFKLVQALKLPSNFGSKGENGIIPVTGWVDQLPPGEYFTAIYSHPSEQGEE